MGGEFVDVDLTQEVQDRSILQVHVIEVNIFIISLLSS